MMDLLAISFLPISFYSMGVSFSHILSQFHSIHELFLLRRILTIVGATLQKTLSQRARASFCSELFGRQYFPRYRSGTCFRFEWSDKQTVANDDRRSVTLSVCMQIFHLIIMSRMIFAIFPVFFKLSCGNIRERSLRKIFFL